MAPLSPSPLARCSSVTASATLVVGILATPKNRSGAWAQNSPSQSL